MKTLFEGTKNVPTYWAACSKREKYVLVIKEGQCGDNFGYVKDIETGKVWIDVKADVIISGDEGMLNYYGGFEYVDEDCTHSLCGYKVYTSESDRVADAIDFYKANKENE